MGITNAPNKENSSCHCFPISSKGTCVKVCTIAECTTKQDTCTWCRNHFLLNTWGTCYYLDVHPYFHLLSCVSDHLNLYKTKNDCFYSCPNGRIFVLCSVVNINRTISSLTGCVKENSMRCPRLSSLRLP